MFDPNKLSSQNISSSPQIHAPRIHQTGGNDTEIVQGQLLAPQPAEPDRAVGGNPWSDWGADTIGSGVDPVNEAIGAILGVINEIAFGTEQPGVQQVPNEGRARIREIRVGGVPPSDSGFTPPGSEVDMAYNTFVGQEFHPDPRHGIEHQDQLRATFPIAGSLPDGTSIPQNLVVQPTGLGRVTGANSNETAVVVAHPRYSEHNLAYGGVEDVDRLFLSGFGRRPFAAEVSGIRELNVHVPNEEGSQDILVYSYNNEGEEHIHIPEEINLYVPEPDKMIVQDDPNWIHDDWRKIDIIHEDIVNEVPGADPALSVTSVYIPRAHISDGDYEEYMQNNVNLINAQELVDTGFPMEVIGTDGEIRQANLKFEQVPDENGNISVESTIRPAQLISESIESPLIEFPEFGTVDTLSEEDTSSSGSDDAMRRIIED